MGEVYLTLSFPLTLVLLSYNPLTSKIYPITSEKYSLTRR